MPRFIHDTALPDMLHGRVLRSEMSAAKLVALKEDAARAVPGLVAIVRDGSFAGVVSETEAGAEVGAHRPAQGRDLDAGRNTARRKRARAMAESPAVGNRPSIDSENGIRDWRQSAHDPAAIYPPLYRTCLDRAVLRHGAMERRPRSRLDPQPGRLFSPRRSRAGVQTAAGEHHGRAYGRRRLLRPQRRRRCRARCGAAGEEPPAAGRSACNGRARTRLSHAPFGAAMAIEIEADLDAQGEIVDWRHSIWGNGHTARPGRAAQPALLAATELANPFPRSIATNPPQANGGGADRNSVPLYDFPSWQIECHRLLDHADPHLGAAHARRAGQCVCDRILSRRTRRRARRGPGRLPPAAFAR